MALAQAPCLARTFGQQYLVSLVGENLREQLPDSDFVVDDPVLTLSGRVLKLAVTIKRPDDAEALRGPAPKGAIAAALSLYDKKTGTQVLLSSHPKLQPRDGGKDVMAFGTPFRAKRLVQRELTFPVPEGVEFDAVDGEVFIGSEGLATRRIGIARLNLEAPKL